MGDGENTNIGELGESREWCSNVKSGLENHWYEDRSKGHKQVAIFGSNKQSKRDSYNDYLKKVVK